MMTFGGLWGVMLWYLGFAIWMTLCALWLTMRCPQDMLSHEHILEDCEPKEMKRGWGEGSVFISLRISKYPGNMNAGEACF